MLTDLDLRALADLQGAERAFVSLYASGEEGRRWAAAREKRLRAMLAAEAAKAPSDGGAETAERQHFDASMQLVHRWLAEHPVRSPGVCVFASWAADFVSGHELPLAVPNLLRVDAAPFLRPLAELRDEYEGFLIVAADNRATRILQVAGAELAGEERVRGDVKNKVRKGGWSQQRYARRREKELHHYAKEVVERLAALVREEGFGRIVLLGTQETLAEIEGSLPADLSGRIAGKRAADLREGDAALLDLAYEAYFEAERSAERRLWERIQEQYVHGGLAAAGAEEVLEALAQGRAEALVVTREARIAGRHCRACDAIAVGEPSACPGCGGDVFACEIVEELVLRAERTGAEVDFVDPIPALAEVGDVAALLRW